MKTDQLFRTLLPVLAGLWFVAGVHAAGEEEFAWTGGLKQEFYGDRSIEEGNSIIELTAPYRAEDAALVPLQITSKIPQNRDHYIKNITLIIDHNPVPFSASFDFTPDSGKAGVALRVRVNAYTFVRAVAETSDGRLHMSKTYVKASGGCSAAIGADLDAALARLGRMKFKFDADKIFPQQPNPVQLLISHPNLTGLQMDQISRLVKPAHFVDEIKVSFNRKPVMTAKTDIAVSADPNFRFYFVPDRAGELRAEIRDNLGNRYSVSQTVAP